MTTSTLFRTNILIGVDDTDNLDSKGTGLLAQRLLAGMEAAGLGAALGATRHQLYVHPDIPYTSHNSSACIAWDAGPRPDIDAIIGWAADFLESESAPGSDPGLVVATRKVWEEPAVRSALSDFGRRAKGEVLDLAMARELARIMKVHASGHGGTSGGIIGALAGVGLHLSGTDGLFLWMPGIRELGGFTTYRELRATVPIDAALDPAGLEPDPDDLIDLGDWVRPILTGHQAVLLLEAGTFEMPGGTDAGGPQGRRWGVACREVVKAH